MRKLIYTVLINGKDDLKDPLEITPGCDYVAFTDDPGLTSSVWNVQVVHGERAPDLRKLSRLLKIIPENEYDQTLYLDASFLITRDLTNLLKNKTEGIWAVPHPQRGCAYREGTVVVEKKLDSHQIVDEQLTKYADEGFPSWFGLWRCGILIRDSRNVKLNDTWWKEVRDYSWRDQISFPYACWKTGIRPSPIVPEVVNYYFKQSLHKAHPTADWKHVGNDVTNLDEIRNRHPEAHLVIHGDNLYFPKWVNNYVTLRFGTKPFIDAVKQLGGTIVNG